MSSHESGSDADFQVLRNRAIIWSAVAIVVFGTGIATWLLLAFGGGGTAERNQLEAIKTAGTVLVAAGGGFALLLAARKQRSTEIALRQADEARLVQIRVADAADADAAERRITELYTKAVDQLGSDHAAVRLGGLYALDRLAQDNPGHRQTIADVLCAYLRMPYEPDESDADSGRAHYLQFGNRTFRSHADTVAVAPTPEMTSRSQERQVRVTAQRILTSHLRPFVHLGESKNPKFWPDIDLDLAGATLVDLDITNCTLRTGIFDGAIFVGTTLVGGVVFTGDAWFSGAIFKRGTGFLGATFGGYAWFGWATFCADAGFVAATFRRSAGFREARFGGDVWFDRAVFASSSQFDKVQFSGAAWFRGTSFEEQTPDQVADRIS